MAMMSHKDNMSRRRLLLSTAAMITNRFMPRQSRAASPNRPNILFVAFDDLSDWIGPLAGYPGKVHTPNFDRLASQGVVFTNAQCSAPVCNASRASLLTGVQPATSGVFDNGTKWREAPALRDAITLPHCFRNDGYRT